jgi:hypothetical protein
MLVEESAPAARQLIASLPADIIKQDHSFKVIIMESVEEPADPNSYPRQLNVWGKLMVYPPSTLYSRR